jgi:hypothetical protein
VAFFVSRGHLHAQATLPAPSYEAAVVAFLPGGPGGISAPEVARGPEIALFVRADYGPLLVARSTKTEDAAVSDDSNAQVTGTEPADLTPEERTWQEGVDLRVRTDVEMCLECRPRHVPPGKERREVVLQAMQETAKKHSQAHCLPYDRTHWDLVLAYFDARYPQKYREEDEKADQAKAEGLLAKLHDDVREAVEDAFKHHTRNIRPGHDRYIKVLTALREAAGIEDYHRLRGDDRKVYDLLNEYIDFAYTQHRRDEDKQAEREKAEKVRYVADVVLECHPQLIPPGGERAEAVVDLAWEAAKEQARRHGWGYGQQTSEVEKYIKTAYSQRYGEEDRRADREALKTLILSWIRDTPPGEGRSRFVWGKAQEEIKSLAVTDDTLAEVWAETYTLDRQHEDDQVEALDALGLEPSSTVPPTPTGTPAEWLVPGLIVQGQTLAIGGPDKALKTSLALDLAVSAATGTGFLNHFPAGPALGGVVVFSGESGREAVGNTVRRICQARGVAVPTNLHVYYQVPNLANRGLAQHLGVLLRQRVPAGQAGLCVIDPLYLALGLADAAGVKPESMFSMGPVLRAFADTCLEAGATPVVVHHAAKALKTGRLMSIQHLSYAGLSQFARQWLLVNHRVPFNPVTGRSSLVVNVGGSAGHSGAYQVDVTEGSMGLDFTGRTWDVTVGPYVPRVKKPGGDDVDATDGATGNGRAKPGARLRAYLTEKGEVLQSRVKKDLHISGSTLRKEISALGENCVPGGEERRPTIRLTAG